MTTRSMSRDGANYYPQSAAFKAIMEKFSKTKAATDDARMRAITEREEKVVALTAHLARVESELVEQKRALSRAATQLEYEQAAIRGAEESRHKLTEDAKATTEAAHALLRKAHAAEAAARERDEKLKEREAALEARSARIEARYIELRDSMTVVLSTIAERQSELENLENRDNVRDIADRIKASVRARANIDVPDLDELDADGIASFVEATSMTKVELDGELMALEHACIALRTGTIRLAHILRDVTEQDVRDASAPKKKATFMF